MILTYLLFMQTPVVESDIVWKVDWHDFKNKKINFFKSINTKLKWADNRHREAMHNSKIAQQMIWNLVQDDNNWKVFIFQLQRCQLCVFNAYILRGFHILMLKKVNDFFLVIWWHLAMLFLSYRTHKHPHLIFRHNFFM